MRLQTTPPLLASQNEFSVSDEADGSRRPPPDQNLGEIPFNTMNNKSDENYHIFQGALPEFQ
jgi:hypothetical protein